MNILSRNSKEINILLFIIFLITGKSGEAATMEVAFPVIVSASASILENSYNAFRIEYTIKPQIFRIPITPQIDEVCTTCHLVAGYGVFNKDGSKVFSSFDTYKIFKPLIHKSTYRDFFEAYNIMAKQGKFDGRYSTLVVDGAIPGVTDIKSICSTLRYSNSKNPIKGPLIVSMGYPGTPVYSECSGAPISSSCSFGANNIEFNYGVLDKSSATGAVLSKDIPVTCTSDVDAALDVSGGSRIYLSNGMEAAITASNGSVGNSVKFISGSQKLTLTSTLSGAPDSSGPFSGSASIIFSYI